MKNWFLAAIACVGFAAPASATWSGFAPIENGILIDAPSVVIDGTGRIHVFGRGQDDGLWHTASKDGGVKWGPWTPRGGILKKAPACMAPYGDSTLDCYVVTTGGVVSQIYRNANGWSGYSSLGGVISSNLSAFAVSPDQRFLAGMGNDAKTFSTRAWNETKGWYPWAGNLPASPKLGWATAVGCAGAPGNTTQLANGVFTDYDYVCMTVANGSGKTTMIAGAVGMPDGVLPAFFDTDYVASSYYAPAVLARSSPRTGNGNVGITADVFMLNKEGTLLNGVYVVGKGWTVKPTPMGIAGTFKSGMSCARRSANGGVKAVCAGLGMDNRIWFMTDK